MSLLITMVTAASFVPGSSGDRKKSPHFQVSKNVSPSYAASEGHSPDTSIGPGSLCGALEFELFIASLIPRYRLRPPSSPRQKNRAPPQKRQWARSLIRWAIIWWRCALSLDRPACRDGHVVCKIWAGAPANTIIMSSAAAGDGSDSEETCLINQERRPLRNQYLVKNGGNSDSNLSSDVGIDLCGLAAFGGRISSC